MDPREDEKRAAAEAAAELVEDGMRLGLGTGTTVAHFLPALARRELPNLVCVSTSFATEEQAHTLGLAVRDFDVFDALDLAVDGADQVGPGLWLVKGGGGAHGREKIAAASAARFVVIVSSDKVVERILPPIPMELLRYGLLATLRRLEGIGPVRIREAAPPSPDGNVIADYDGPVGDPVALANDLQAVPGVVAHGLFPGALVTEVLVGRSDGWVERLRP
jgi:ribose 5-phosphate isomerase A